MEPLSRLEELLDEHDVARITSLSVASIRRWRLLKQGPKYPKDWQFGSIQAHRPHSVARESRPAGGGHPGDER